MKFDFILTKPSGQLRKVSELLDALNGGISENGHTFLYREDEAGNVIELKDLDDVQHSKARFEQWTRNLGALQEAAQNGEIDIVLQDPDTGLCWIVDRFFWNQNSLASSRLANSETCPEHLTGLPFLADTANLHSWRSIVEQADLGPSEKTVAPATLPRWATMSHPAKETERQWLVMRFFGLTKQHHPGGTRELNVTQFLREYVKWIAAAPAHRGAPFGRTAFEQWFRRYRDGWRLPDVKVGGWQRISD